ncbi:MAG: peptide chain release factor 3 [Myxococcota bacterium]
MDLADEVRRRRTFAIISHPDAGKTTLTEKLLLYAGAVHVAGAVKSRKASRHALSDWMEMEKEKGISITSSVLQFDYGQYRMNLLDTPGHADFSEDTYRVLAAVDSAIMLIDAAKGVEPRTLKLFEVCRIRKLPVTTFVNKMDRPGRDPLDLLDDVGKTLAIRTVPLNWPIGQDAEFTGVFDRLARKAVLWERQASGTEVVPEVMFDLDDPGLVERIGNRRFDDLRESVELLDAAGDPFSDADYLAGDVTPFYFGSAMTNFGVSQLLASLGTLAPPPTSRPATDGGHGPDAPEFAGFVFKIQANMNPRHRDRIAFMRVVSGRFERGMDVKVARTEGKLRLSKPHTFLAQERSIVDEAFPGDIVGLYDPGELRIGDTLYTGPKVEFKGIPRFAPEYFARIRLKDPTRRKHLQEGLQQLSQEGTIQLFYRAGLGAADPYLGAVGLLQFEVLKVRLENEYNTRAELEPAPFTVARWVGGAPSGLEWLKKRPDYVLVEDRYGHPVVLSPSPWPLNYALAEAPGLELHEISPL